MTKRIAYITDIHLDESTPAEIGVDTRNNLRLILKDIAAKGADEIIFGGDIGEIEAYSWFFQSLKNYTQNLKITLGNHDTLSEVIKYYSFSTDYESKELYYSYEDEYYKHIFLDSSAYEISDIQYKWLTGEMDTPKKVILFIHHPVLKVDSAADKAFPLQGREKIKEALHKHKSEVYIFCGHYHTFDERTDGNIKQFITPAASFQMADQEGKIVNDTSWFGYRIINIANGDISSQVVLNKDFLL